MKVNSLQLFLRSLRSAVSAADVHSSLPAELEAVSAGFEAFAGLDFGQFAAFLRQAQQYRDSGAVSVPSPTSLSAEKAKAALRSAAYLGDKLSGEEGLDALQVTAEWEKARKELEQSLAAFLEPLAITVTFKGDQKRFQAALKRPWVRALAGRVRAALDGVTDEASLNAPERQEKLRTVMDQILEADLKAVATELGAPVSRGKDALVSAIVERLTGLKPAAKKATRASGKPAVDQAAVQQQAVKLKGLLEKSLDPGGLSSAELEAAISELEQSSLVALQAIAKEVGLEKVGKSKESILKKIREKLGAAERARESIQV